jgi:VanZ family protein
MNTEQLISWVQSTKFRRWSGASAIALFSLIVVLGSIPGARDEIGQLATGVVLHSLAYAVLAALTFTALSGASSRRAVFTVLSIAVMGAVDEGVQSLFPYRHAAIGDWLVDVTAGVLTAAVFGYFQRNS